MSQAFLWAACASRTIIIISSLLFQWKRIARITQSRKQPKGPLTWYDSTPRFAALLKSYKNYTKTAQRIQRFDEICKKRRKKNGEFCATMNDENSNFKAVSQWGELKKARNCNLQGLDLFYCNAALASALRCLLLL